MKNIQINWSRVLEVFYFIFLIAIAMLAIVNLTSRVPNKSPVKILSVVSGSMSPAIPVGSAIFVQKASDYSRDDVITYRLNNNYVTHRVFYAGDYYLTKGDANKDVDQVQVLKDQILGKVTFSVPYVGYLQESTKSLWGLIGFVYIPTMIVLITESRLIVSEIKKVGLKKIPLQSVGTICIGIFVMSGMTLSFYSTKTTAFSADLAAVFPSPSGSATPTPSGSATPSPTSSPSPTVTPTATPIASATPTSFPCPTSGASNCGNGSGSNNTVIIENNNTTIINQNNSSTSNTTVIVNQQTGSNGTENNASGSAQISTGNTSVSSYTSTIVNTNTVTTN